MRVPPRCDRHSLGLVARAEDSDVHDHRHGPEQVVAELDAAGVIGKKRRRVGQAAELQLEIALDVGLRLHLLGLDADDSQSSVGDLELDLVVGDRTVATVELHRDHLAAEIDLGRVIDAMESSTAPTATGAAVGRMR